MNLIEELELLVKNYETTGTSLSWLYDGVLTLIKKYKLVNDINKELVELIASAGPLHWVMTEDADAAKAWEIKASALLARFKEEENEVS